MGTHTTDAHTDQQLETSSPTLHAGSDWTADELRAAVRAYLNMLKAEQADDAYSKAGTNRALREGPLAARSKGAVEYRMGNISAVMIALGQPWIEGYKPARNVGDRVKRQIRNGLAEFGITAAPVEPVPPGERLERMVRQIRRAGSLQEPVGTKAPAAVTVTEAVFLRDPAVKAWVLEQAHGVCEACGSAAPFSTPSGEPFLEVHHVRPLGDGGSDTITNAVAVCPNCHSRFHFAGDKDAYTNSLFGRVPRLVREPQSSGSAA